MVGGHTGDQRAMTTTTFSHEVEVVGYVVDALSLRSIDRHARGSLCPEPTDQAAIDTDCTVTIEGGAILRFKSLEMLVDHFEVTKDRAKELGLEYYARDRGRISIFFD